MCGIAGFLSLNEKPASISVLQAMTEAVAHRGPDGDGHFIDGPLALGHRRLAIIDLSPAGRQPMATADGRYTLSYNGLIYNFQELRTQLQARGHRFISNSDTEVVMYALAEWGTDALSRFNGMFAFALWDSVDRKLVLARDRYGIKPLYYTIVGSQILFASEAKAFLVHPDFQARLCNSALVEYMNFQNLFSDRTLLDGVHILPPASWLTASLNDGQIRRNEYWDFSFSEPSSQLPYEEQVEVVDQLFRQAVQRQLVSDVPIGAYLSGGVDSGSITAVAAQDISNLRTFTVGFDLRSASGLEIAFDERETAEYMSYLFGTEHYEMVLKAGDMERCMRRLVWQLEEPRVGQSYPNFYAALLASRFGKVVLSGAGGDELFAGYPWRYYRVAEAQDFEQYVDNHYAYWQRLLPAEAMSSVFAPLGAEANTVSTREIFRDVFHSHADQLTQPEDFIHHSMYFEAKTFLHGLLVVEDKLSMAHGLETRVPFLDNDLVDYAQHIPAAYKLRLTGDVLPLNENETGNKAQRYYAETRDGKLLLRDVMRRYVPQEVIGRRKQGFSAPDASWFRGESIDYVRRTLFNDKARLYDVLDRRTIQSLVTDHLEGRNNRRLLIWSLLWLEQWLRIFLDGETVPA